MFGLAKSIGTRIIIRTPLVFKFLTGKISGIKKFGENDHRSNYPKIQLNNCMKNTKKLPVNPLEISQW